MSYRISPYLVWTLMAIAAGIYVRLTTAAAEPSDYVDIRTDAYFLIFGVWLVGLPLIKLVVSVLDEIRRRRTVNRYMRERRSTNPPLRPRM